MEEFYTPRGSEEWETWQCPYQDLVSLHSTITALLAASSSGRSSDAVLLIGCKRVHLLVADHCPTVLPVSKRLLALQVPFSPSRPASQLQAYITQLENELENVQSQSAFVTCPCEGHRQEENREETMLFRRSQPADMRITVKRAQCLSVKHVAELKDTLNALERCKKEWENTRFTTKSTLREQLSLKAELKRLNSGIIEISSMLEGLRKGISKPFRKVSPFGSANIPHKSESKENSGDWNGVLEGVYQRIRALLSSH